MGVHSHITASYSQSFIMNLASQLSDLKINAPVPKYSSWGYQVDPIEYTTDTESVSGDRVKANQTSKRTWMISANTVKKSKFQEDRVHYLSGGEDSDGEDGDSTDSDCGSDSEIVCYCQLNPAAYSNSIDVRICPNHAVWGI
ncbi:hypothetical protein M378DRAFT_179967 [Amanita muscaria Koide BX008]|uniref:Uncharacterized protein n=1 Tax=Amanita muscaria (strain Koide BX008) TaxID=946122 RepID=A0A0C2SF83_AMAMK|nr:hypothetical protein M378DRAFT_179967 [Amanita muscaria Koide BX008]